jgi:hypothetical protein
MEAEKASETFNLFSKFIRIVPLDDFFQSGVVRNCFYLFK